MNLASHRICDAGAGASVRGIPMCLPQARNAVKRRRLVNAQWIQAAYQAVTPPIPILARLALKQFVHPRLRRRAQTVKWPVKHRIEVQCASQRSLRLVRARKPFSGNPIRRKHLMDTFFVVALGYN